MHPRHLDTPPTITRAIGLALFGMALGSVPAAALLPAQAMAQTQGTYQIPAGPLGAALTQFGVQAGVTLSFDTEQTRQLTTNGLSGSYSVEEGLQRLLANSGLRAQRQANGGYVLIPAGDGSALELGATNVNAQTLGAVTEGSGSYTTGSTSTATKLPMSLRETPQSVTVITRQRMDDQNIQSLDEVARTTPGISYTKIGTDRSTYYARGFEINDLQFDGIASNISENYSMDVMSTANMAIYDRVEVVRGANGLLQGTGNPSAAINLVRKRPTADFRLGAELGAGSWDNYRSQLDVSGPLTDSGNVRGRAVAYYNTADSYRDGAQKDNQLLYLIGEADLDDATTLAVGATVQKDNNNGYDWGGLNTRADGSFYPLSRSTSLAGDWAHLDRNNYNLFSDLTHQFDNDWKLTLALNSIWSDADFLSSYPARVSGDNYRLVVSQADYKDRQNSQDLYATGPFQLFGREHQLMLGASNREDEFDVGIHTASNTPTVNITDFDYSAIPAPALNTAQSDYRYVRKEKGLYGATRLSLTDDLSLILGSRVSWSNYKVQSPTLNAPPYKEDGKVIPYAGLVYDLDQNHTLYTSYTEIYRVQSYYSEGDKLLAPVEGANYEAGIKSTYFGGRFNTALAVFQTDLSHMPEATSGPRICGVTGTSSCYVEGGKVRNQGFEIEVSGQPLKGWNLSAGYTYSDPHYIAGANKGTDYYTRIPRRLLKLATDYQLPGALDQWRVGVDLYMQSRTYVTSSTYDIEQSGYGLLNLHAHYQIDRNFSLQYNLNNALDKKYYQSLPTSNNWGGLYYGDPRNFALTLRYQY